MFVYLISLLSPTSDIAAYLDPGSGSFIIQLLIGGVVGLALVVRTFWGRIKLFINNLLGRETEVNPALTDPDMEQYEDDDFDG